MKTLVESLFDKDIVEKDPIDFSHFKSICKRLETRADMFKIMMGIMMTDSPLSWMRSQRHPTWM